MILADFIARLDGAKKSGKEWIARCPAHDDKNPSLSVSNGGGKILIYCHAGCSTESIVSAMGLRNSDLYPDNDGTHKATGKEARPIIATHDYPDVKGRFLFQKARFTTKPKTKPRHRGPNGRWQWGTGTDERPLYRLPEILGSDEVVVCEGEKDADSLVKLGFKATTTPFGKWEQEHIKALSGKDILIAGDNDKVGEQKVQKAVEALRGHAKSIRIVELPTEGKPEGFDVSDFIAEFDEPEAAAEKLSILMEQARIPESGVPKEAGFPPLTPAQTVVHGSLIREPPDVEPILLYNGFPVLTRNVVGEIAAEGGAGKTMLSFQLGYAISGGNAFGPFTSVGEQKVLILCAEDPQEEANRRLWRIGAGDFPTGLHVASTVGHVGPLMELKENNPKKAKGFTWLRDTIKNHAPLDLLILDPKSRFYGLDENSNDHATQWIACLESLSNEFDLTILFTHHVSKGRAGDMGQAMSRGASALVDGCRWVAGMTRLNEEIARRHGIVDERSYLEFDITKSNYTAKLPNRFIFKQAENGLLEYVPLEMKRQKNLKNMLYDGIVQSEKTLSRRDLIRGKNGAEPIIEDMETAYPTFSKRELNQIINELICDGFVKEIPEKNNRRGAKKMWLKPVDPETSGLREKRN